MTKVKHIVRLENGKYVKDRQYSQGHFTIAETTDIFKACEIDQGNFNIFFKDEGAERLEFVFKARRI